jgi:hypothetical protein
MDVDLLMLQSNGEIDASDAYYFSASFPQPTKIAIDYTQIANIASRKMIPAQHQLSNRWGAARLPA